MRDTIELAREAGDDWDSTLSTDKEFLKRFEAFVRADEREACANVCEDEICSCCWDDEAKAAAEHLAEAIRARGAKHD